MDKINESKINPDPIKGGEKKGQTVTFRDHLVSYGCALKEVAAYIRVIAERILHSISEARTRIPLKLQNKADHLHAEKRLPMQRTDFGEHLLVPARNIAHSRVFASSQLSSEDLVRARRGVCAGACIDVAHQLSSLTKEEIIKITAQYEKGMGESAVVNQFAYGNFKRKLVTVETTIRHFLSEELKGEEKDLAIKLMVYLMNPSLKSNGEDLYRFIAGAEQFAPFILAVLKKVKEGGEISQGIQSVISKSNLGELGSHLFHLVEHYSSNIDSRFSAVKRAAETPLSKKIASLPLEQPESPKIETLHGRKWRIFYLNEDKMADLMSYNSVAQKKGLKVVDPYKVKRGTENDITFLKKLNETEKGVHMMIFNTGSGMHATLFINNGDEKFFWDPNFGLFQLEKDAPQDLILRIFDKFYPSAKGLENGNHGIQLYKFEKSVAYNSSI